MKIYRGNLDAFAADIVDKCFATRRERVQMYNGLNHYYLFGAQDGNQSPYGKIYPHIDLLKAYLYSEGTVEYDVAVQDVEEVVSRQSELIEHRLNSCFHDHGIAGKFGECLQWSLVYNSAFLKVIPSVRPFRLKPYFVEPHNIGVLNESVPDLEDQEAFCHSYYMSKSELLRRIEGRPDFEDIKRRIVAQPISEEDVFPESIHRIIVAGPANMTTSTTRGIVNIPELFNQLQYKPKVSDDVIEMNEVWVWDDEREDYRTLTVAAPGVLIYGSADSGNTLGIKGEHPFIHLCPNRIYNYFFGWSEIVGLIRLQDWLSERLREVRSILTLQANPPRAFSGFGGLNEEKMAAFNSPNAWVSDPTPNAKVETLSPEVPPAMFDELMFIQSMFNDISGLSDVLQGKGDTGVRSKAQTDTLAKLGSARIKQRAQNVERCLEELGGLMMKMMKVKDDHKYFIDSEKQQAPFTAGMFTDEYQVNVDAHSASPVFVDDHVQLAMALKKLGVIDNQSVLELTKPPKLDTLKKRAQKAEQARAAQMQAMMQAGMAPSGKKLKGV